MTHHDGGDRERRTWREVQSRFTLVQRWRTGRAVLFIARRTPFRKEHVMTTSDNKAVVRRFNEIVGQYFRGGDVSGIDEVCTPDIVLHGPGMPPDLAGFKQMVPAFRAAFSEVEVVTEDLVAEGDRVVDRITVRGIHQGEFIGIPPSGQRFELEEIHIARIVDGKIVERWTQYDMFGLLQQIGGVPGSPASA